ncbi:hypothetical protein [Streptomyces sp. KHY 26]|uniref:hypothetical protein n=1 Tax=Streptomyces sp. KHY 26 TaxID=3097359 RepID=UPI00376F3353
MNHPSGDRPVLGVDIGVAAHGPPAWSGDCGALRGMLGEQAPQLFGGVLALICGEAFQCRFDTGLPGRLLTNPDPVSLIRLGGSQDDRGLVQALQLRPLTLRIAPAEPVGHRPPRNPAHASVPAAVTTAVPPEAASAVST